MPRGIAALYTEDAQLLPPDLEIVSGRAAIQEFFARTNPPGSAAIEIATVETHVFGDYAHRQGSFLLKGPDGGTVRAGKFLELWKKAGRPLADPSRHVERERAGPGDRDAR